MTDPLSDTIDSAERLVEEERTADRVLSAGFAVTLLVTTAPLRLTTVGGLVGTLAFVACGGLLLYVALRLGKHATATLSCMFFLAYGLGMSGSLETGASRGGAAVSAGATQLAAGMVVAFIAVALAAACLELLFVHASPRTVSLPNAWGTAALVVIAGVAAVRSGAWSYWAGEGVVEQTMGGLRMELLYGPALFCSVGVLGAAPLARTPKLVLGAVLVVPIFVLQSRRLMIASVLLALVTSARVLLKRKRGGAIGLGLASAVSVAALAASTAWRATGSSGSIIDRFVKVASRSLQDPSVDVESFEERASYLWVDALSSTMPGYAPFTLADSATTSLQMALPSVVFPDKGSVEAYTCETVYAGLGLFADLPCTPITEGMLAGGMFGVFVAAIAWGLQLALCDWLLRVGSPAGFLLLAPLIAIEADPFPFFQGGRTMLIGAAVIFAGAVVARAVFGSRASPHSNGASSLRP